MPYMGTESSSSEAAGSWHTAIKNALVRRITGERLEASLSQLRERFPISSRDAANVLFGFRAAHGCPDDPLFFEYARLFLKTNSASTGDLLTVLLKTSPYGHGNGDPAETRRLGLPSCEEKTFNLLTQAHIHAGLPNFPLELYRIVVAIADWLHVVSQYETRKQLEGAGLHTVDWYSYGMYESLGNLATCILGNEGIRAVSTQRWWKARRADVVREMESYDVHVLQWMQSQVAGRLRALTGMPPFIEIDSKGRPVLNDQQVLDSIPQVPIVQTRAALFLWLNAALAARPLTDDMAMLSYLHSRYPGNVQSLIVALLVACFDNLTNSMMRQESAQSDRVIRSFICNKVPVLLVSLAGNIAPPMTAETCIQMAFMPGGMISMNPLPPISAGASNVQDRLKGVRLEFLQACALHGLVSENTVASILNEAIALPRVIKHSKEALVAQCANNISRLEGLIDDLGAMQGNAGAIATCIVQTIGNLCMSKDTMSLKSVCNELIKKIALTDVIMQYTQPSTLLLPLCNLLDGWVHDQDQTEFTPSYEEFASILLLTLAVINRYDIQWPSDIGLISGTFIPRLLDEIASSKPPSELPDSQATQLAKWIEGLFAVDEHGETSGIGDDVMRQCSPQDFYLLVPTLFEQSVLACRCNTLSMNSFKGGLELLLEPFLLPSLVMGLGWLAEHSWEDHNDVEVLLHVLEKLLRPASSSPETQAMHRAILGIVATPLYNSLQELTKKRPDKKDQAVRLSALLKPYVGQRRTLNCRRDEVDEWLSSAGGLQGRISSSIRDLVNWASTSDPPPRYAHKMFALACQIIDADILLDTIVKEIVLTPIAQKSVAMDVVTAMICAPTRGSMTQASHSSSSGSTTRLQTKIRMLTSDTAALLDRPKAHAEALVQLSRQVDAQLSAVSQLPPPMLVGGLQEHDADQIMQDLGLEIPVDNNTAMTDRIDLAGLAQEMDMNDNTNLANATVQQTFANMAAESAATGIDMDLTAMDMGGDGVGMEGMGGAGEEEDIFGGLADLGDEFNF